MSCQAGILDAVVHERACECLGHGSSYMSLVEKWVSCYHVMFVGSHAKESNTAFLFRIGPYAQGRETGIWSFHCGEKEPLTFPRRKGMVYTITLCPGRIVPYWEFSDSLCLCHFRYFTVAVVKLVLINGCMLSFMHGLHLCHCGYLAHVPCTSTTADNGRDWLILTG